MVWMIKAAWKPSWFNEDKITFVVFVYHWYGVQSAVFGERCTVYVPVRFIWVGFTVSLHWHDGGYVLFVCSNAVSNLELRKINYSYFLMLFWLSCAVLYMQQFNFAFCILPRAGSYVCPVGGCCWVNWLFGQRRGDVPVIPSHCAAPHGHRRLWM